MTSIVAIVIAYLLGSVSCAIILAKIQKQTDPRELGSGNAGATNVLRNSGKKEAMIVVLGDIIKALLAVVIARGMGVNGFWLGLVAAAAIAGHIFPVFFQFKGGKGVACFLGALIGLSFLSGIIFMVVWALVAYFSKYSSLASLIAAGIGALLAIISGGFGLGFGMLLAAGLIVYKHLSNIERLRHGTENKLSF